MLNKIGVNTTRTKKAGPPVRDAIAKPGHKKVITCACGTRLEKSCANEYMCDISKVNCPKCGKRIG